MKIYINKKDIHRQTYHCGGPGGQRLNKVETGVRYTHIPTGIRGESCTERYQGKNDGLAYERLLVNLSRYFETKQRERARERYDSKPDAAFGRQIRTYYLCGQKRVIDHQTGEEYNPEAILNGVIPLPKRIGG